MTPSQKNFIHQPLDQKPVWGKRVLVLSKQQARFVRQVGACRGIALLWAISCLLLIGPSVAYAAGSDRQEAKHFDIPQQQADVSLITFAEQADITLIFTFELARDKTTNRLVGSYHPKEAIQLLLDGTGLKPTFSSDGHINIASAEAPVAREEQMISKKAGFLAAIAFFFTAGAGAQDSGNTDGASGAEKNRVLEEVLVTAQKRGEQTLIEVPQSVTAFDGDNLTQTGAVKLEDFLQLSPGVSIVSYMGTSRIQIRGISSALGSATVGYYVDEAPFGFVTSNFAPNSRAFDMERVEVLRGPQNTLYGQGSIAGVIKLITKNPSLHENEFRADVSGSSTKGGGFNQQYNVGFGIPIVEDKLAIRFTGTYEDSSGWIDGNPGMGTDGWGFGDELIFQDDKNLNDEQFRSGRLKVLWTPTDDLAVTGLYWMNNSDFGAPANAEDDGTRTLAIPEPVENRYEFAYLSFEYQAENFTFTSVTNYNDALFLNHADFNGTDLLSKITNDGWSQELRLNSTGEGPWLWTVGGLYSSFEESSFQDVDQRIADMLGLNDVDDTNDTVNWALFGDVTYLFNDKWEASIGARYFKDERDTKDVQGFFIGDEVITQKFDDFSPRFNVAYHPTDTSTLYFQAAKGFRSGLNQFPISFFFGQLVGIELPMGAEEEDLWAYELGYKGEFQDGRLFIEAAAFLNDWNNLQQSAPAVVGVLNAIVNAGSAKSPGVELAIKQQTTDTFSWGVSASWNDAKYGEDVTVGAIDPATGETVPVVLFPKDERLASVPEWTGNVWVDFNWPLGLGDGTWEGYAHADVQCRDTIYTSAGGLFRYADKITQARARIGIQNDEWGIFLYGENLTGEDGAFNPGFPPLPPQRLRPRTIGLNLKYAL